MLSSAARLLDSRLKQFSLVIGLGFILVIGFLGYIAGPQISASLFYLLPVLFVARFSGRAAGLVTAACAAGIWLVADLAHPMDYAHPLVPYWNALMRFSVFLVVVLLVATMRSLNENLEDRVEKRTAELQAEIQERQELEKRILEISDREQARIGQDLHDGLCQQLVGTAFAANLLQQKLASHSRPEAKEAAEIAALLDGAITQSHNLARGLYPVRLEAEGLITAIRELASNVSHRFNVRCSANCQDLPEAQDNATAIHLFRIAQEAVNNAIKHARPRQIDIALSECAGEVLLTVSDDGIGMNRLAYRSTGMGLHIIKYRANAIGGTLEINTNPQGGTTITCRVKPQRHKP